MRALSLVLGGRLRGTTSPATLLGLAMGVFLAAAPAEAEKVGVAAAVNPDAFSSLSGAPQSQLNIGKSIFYNERINTTGSGLVQVLLVDGSTFTVGPGSDLVIDRFVYNPKKQTGQVVATFSKGVVRYVGGKISKNDAGVTIKTPTGALAIRGGMVQGNGKVWSFLYGTAMSFTGKNGQTYTVYQPGYTLDLSGGVPKIRPTTSADINAVMTALTNGNTGGIGNAGDDGNPDAQQQLLAETISLQDLISDAATDRITDTIASQEVEDGGDTPPPPPPPPPPRTDGTFNGYAAGWYLDVPDTTGIDTNDYSNGYGDVESGRLANLYPESVSVTFNAAQNTVSASLRVRAYSGILPLGYPYGGGATIGFGEPSIFASDSNFAATARADQTSILSELGQIAPATSVAGGLISGSGPLCANCDFLRWGSWVSAIAYDEHEYNEQTSPRIAGTIGWWITGNLPTEGEIALIDQGTATYDGTTIGTVIPFDHQSDEWGLPLTAAGTVNMDWDFAQRSGLLEIKNFKSSVTGAPPAINISGTMRVPGQLDIESLNRFSGRLSGNVGADSSIHGFASGSFARNGKDPIGGVVGNWSASNSDVRANAIFGASKTGFNPNASFQGH